MVCSELGSLPIPAASPIVSEKGDFDPVLSSHPVIGAGHGLGHPPQVESPLLLDTSHLFATDSP